MNPRRSKRRTYPNNTPKGKRTGLRLPLRQTFWSWSSSLFFKCCEMNVRKRMEPKRTRQTPKKKGISPGPGLWRSPNFSLIDSRLWITPSPIQIKLVIRLIFFIKQAKWKSICRRCQLPLAFSNLTERKYFCAVKGNKHQLYWSFSGWTTCLNPFVGGLELWEFCPFPHIATSNGLNTLFRSGCLPAPDIFPKYP